jgi:sugar phosphate isomerase/epimerase
MLPGIDMAADLDLAVAAGLDAIGVSRGVLERTGLDTTIELLRDRSMIASSYAGGVSVLGMPDEMFDETVRAGVTTAAALGASSIVVVPGLAGERTPDEADDEIVARLGRMASFANEHGVRFAVEPLHPFLHTLTYVHTFGHAAALASRVEGGGVTLDLVHTHWDRHLLDDITACVDSVAVVHVGNLSRAALDAKTWLRSPPDDGVIPVGQLIRALHAAGYRGPYELEVITPSMSVDECQTVMRDAGEWFAALWRD